MIAITPPKIFSEGGSPKQATPLTAPATALTTKNRFTPNFWGWGLDENLKPKSPPYRGVHYRGSAARQNEAGSRLAHPPRRLHPALRSRCAPCSRSFLYDCAKKSINLTVKRRYLTQREVERLMDCARKHGRYGHRDATMILIA